MALIRNAEPKPLKGTALLASRERRQARVSSEQAVMKLAKKRDEHKCRVPRCQYATKKLPIDVAHERHRGSGGNPKGDRTTLETCIALCRAHHGEYDAGILDIEPKTRARMSGPCDFLRKHHETGRMEQFASETRVGISVAVGA